jgi:hypothetical protein
MELRGFEPLTSSVRLTRAPSCATAPYVYRVYSRTGLLSNAAIWCILRQAANAHHPDDQMLGVLRVEIPYRSGSALPDSGHRRHPFSPPIVMRYECLLQSLC